jgi:berberine-like enzyme
LNVKPSLVKKSTGRFRVPDEEIYEHLARRGDRHWLPPAGLCPIDAPRRRNSSVALEAERDRTVRPAAGAAPSAGSASRCLDRDPPTALLLRNGGRWEADASEGDERARAAYGADYPRLVALKSKYDPSNFFRSNQNIQPAA